MSEVKTQKRLDLEIPEISMEISQKPSQNRQQVTVYCRVWISADQRAPQKEHVGVSKNNGTPQTIHVNGVFHYKPSILGYPYFWKHPGL